MIKEYEGEAIEEALLRFTADWCAPCRVYGPQFDQVAAGRKTQCYVVDIEQYPELAALYGVRSIPAVVQVEEGQGVKLASVPTPEQIVQLVD